MDAQTLILQRNRRAQHPTMAPSSGHPKPPLAGGPAPSSVSVVNPPPTSTTSSSSASKDDNLAPLQPIAADLLPPRSQHPNRSSSTASLPSLLLSSQNHLHQQPIRTASPQPSAPLFPIASINSGPRRSSSSSSSSSPILFRHSSRSSLGTGSLRGYPGGGVAGRFHPSSLPTRGFVTGPPSRDHWKPDASAPDCDLCGTRFGLITRRHHCRMCGGVFCGPCASQFVRLDQNAKPHAAGVLSRVCAGCVEGLESYLTGGGGAGTTAASSSVGGRRSSSSEVEDVVVEEREEEDGEERGEHGSAGGAEGGVEGRRRRRRGAKERGGGGEDDDNLVRDGEKGCAFLSALLPLPSICFP
ncbi:FYVE zinc finger-domain-containing protein [Zopfochytrium polystomum]|nr:FYVE zinc finger-domain-containing protein [Zopfochytrium polystomum]